MRSTEFITEDTKEELQNDPEFQKQIQLIQQDCQPFIQQAQGKIMFRGLPSTDGFIKKRARLDDRRPKDTGQERHDEFNKYFLKHFGENFRNGVFVSGDSKIAEYYGNIYSIFPIGEFKFLWSPSVIDLGEQFKGKSTNIFKNIIQSLLYSDDKVNSHFLEKADYRTTDLAQAIQSGHEIMLFTKEYYGLK